MIKQKSFFYAESGTYLILTVLFLSSLCFPYNIDVDIGVQVKSLQQYLQGFSHALNQVRLADPADLSHLKTGMIIWFAPAFPYLELGLAKSGLPLVWVIRFSVFLFFMAGAIGFFRIVRVVDLGWPAWTWLMVTLPCWYLTIGSPFSLIMDTMVFGLFPWLFLGCWKFLEDYSGASRPKIGWFGVLLAVGLGLIYLIKYSGFFISCALLGFIGLEILINCPLWPLRKKIIDLGLLGVLFLLPPLSLMFWQLTVIGDLPLNELKKTLPSNIFEVQKLVWPLGAWGASIFGLFHPVNHLVNYMDRFFPWMSRLGNNAERTWVVSLGCFPGTLFLLWGFMQARKRFSARLILACSSLLVIFFLLQGYVTYRYYQDTIVNNWRYTAPFAPLIEMVLFQTVVSVLLEQRNRMGQIGLGVGVFFLTVIPLLFNYGRLLKSDVMDRKLTLGHPSKTGLYLPYLSKTNLDGLIDRVQDLRRSPEDVVAVIVHPLRSPQYGTWLIFRDPILPLIPSNWTFWDDFGASIQTLDSSSIRSSQSLRVVLVVAQEFLDNKQRLPLLLARFTQIAPEEWKHEIAPNPEEAEIWYGDITVPPEKADRSRRE